MRLINADTLLQKVEEAYKYEDRRGQLGHALRCIKEAPTIEAEPVKHGRWTPSKSRGLPTNRFVCSECSGLTQVSTYRYHCMCKYCPTCGARMDEEV